MTRVVPALIVLAIVALMAATAGHPTAPVPATVNAKPVSAERSNVTGTAVSFNSRRKNETARQKARRIITATWPSSQVDNAMKVVACESGFNQWAANLRDRHSDGSIGSYGYFQVGALWRHDPEVKGNINRLYLPWTNARVAYRIWKRQGWWAWRNCAMRAGLL